MWIRIAIGVCVFFALRFATDPIHDWLFLSHTSIQNDISVCSAGGADTDCWTEDDARAYDTRWWAIAGNAVALLLAGMRAAIGYYVYLRILPSPKGV